MTEPQHSGQQNPTPTPTPTLAQRTVAFAFIGAFALTMATVIFTGLNVERPRARAAGELLAVTLALGEPHTVNLVFDSRAPLADVEFTVDVPPGIELVERPGEQRVVWRASLAQGSNVLPLTLVARGGSGGTLGARLRDGGEQKTFAVDLAIAAP